MLKIENQNFKCHLDDIYRRLGVGTTPSIPDVPNEVSLAESNSDDLC